MTEPMSFEREWREIVQRAASRAASEAEPLRLPPERRLPLSRVALVATLEEVQHEWRAVQEGIDAETASRFVNAAWTLKDLLAHMASWAREFRVEIETVHAGGSFDYAIPHAMGVAGPNAWNEVEVSKRRSETLEAIFAEYAGETERLQELVIEMADETLYRAATFPLAPSGDPSALMKGPPAFIVHGKCIHDLYHLGQIKSRLPRLSD